MNGNRCKLRQGMQQSELGYSELDDETVGGRKRTVELPQLLEQLLARMPTFYCCHYKKSKPTRFFKRKKQSFRYTAIKIVTKKGILNDEIKLTHNQN